MQKPTDDLLLNLWTRALDCEIGLGLTVSDRKFFINNLYRVRQESGSAELQQLIIMQPNEPSEIFICKKHQEGLNAK